jgi:uncharacterized protein HemX
MDTNDNQQSTSTPVMDIQPPKPAPTDTAAPVSIEVAPAETLGEDTISNESPATNGPESATASDPTSAPAAPTPPADTPNPMAITQPGPKKSGTPKGAVIAAIIIGLALAAVAVFAYKKTQMKDHSTTNVTTSTQNSKVTTKDVDDTTQAIDDNLKTIDDTKDFADTNLSDTSLGL